MIDDFEAVQPPGDQMRADQQQRPPPPPDDDAYDWRSEFRSYLDDPE